MPKAKSSPQAVQRARAASHKDATTQTQLSLSLGPIDAEDPASKSREPSPVQLAQEAQGPPDTPRASRITKESWGLASLDPSTWPVFKDGFGSCNSLTIAPVPEGDPASEGGALMDCGDADALATARAENESLRQLCYDLISLAQDVDFPEAQAPPSQEMLIAEARKSLLTMSQLMLRAATQRESKQSKPSDEISARGGLCREGEPAKPGVTSKSSWRWRPISASSSPSEPVARSMNETAMSTSTACTTCTASTPTEACQSIKTASGSPVSRVLSLDGRGSPSQATWPVSPIWSPPMRTRVTRFASDGTCSPILASRATLPVPVHGLSLPQPVYSAPQLGRSRSVSVTRRHYRQCWVLEREEHVIL
ncbi:unnamed protein product [Symbiodinium natans]|uniref:Uncharacterized protein n=1 Tax=Symbiodinium natans TaxID=878477 RepID=A0A812U987_9DINO|nr:unnamed protein product [Symbiodinium natans]